MRSTIASLLVVGSICAGGSGTRVERLEPSHTSEAAIQLAVGQSPSRPLIQLAVGQSPSRPLIQLAVGQSPSRPLAQLA